MLKKGIMKCFEAYLYDDNGDVLAVDENLTSASLSQACEEAEIRNGKDNSVWSVINHSKTLEGEIQSNILDIEKIALLAGSSIVSGATTVHTQATVYTIASRSITLAETPLSEDDVKIVDIEKDVVLKKTTDYTMEGKTITFTSLDAKDVKVLPYKYTSVAGAKEIVISSDKFPAACRLLLKSVYINEEQEITHTVEVELPVVKPKADWSLSTQSDFSGGMDNTLSFKAQKDAGGNLGYIRFIPRA